MRGDENGYIVVETITCFILFVFLNISILSLIGMNSIPIIGDIQLDQVCRPQCQRIAVNQK